MPTCCCSVILYLLPCTLPVCVLVQVRNSASVVPGAGRQGAPTEEVNAHFSAAASFMRSLSPGAFELVLKDRIARFNLTRNTDMATFLFQRIFHMHTRRKSAQHDLGVATAAYLKQEKQGRVIIAPEELDALVIERAEDALLAVSPPEPAFIEASRLGVLRAALETVAAAAEHVAPAMQVAAIQVAITASRDASAASGRMKNSPPLKDLPSVRRRIDLITKKLRVVELKPGAKELHPDSIITREMSRLHTLAKHIRATRSRVASTRTGVGKQGSDVSMLNARLLRYHTQVDACCTLLRAILPMSAVLEARKWESEGGLSLAAADIAREGLLPEQFGVLTFTSSEYYRDAVCNAHSAVQRFTEEQAYARVAVQRLAANTQLEVDAQERRVRVLTAPVPDLVMGASGSGLFEPCEAVVPGEEPKERLFKLPMEALDAASTRDVASALAAEAVTGLCQLRVQRDRATRLHAGIQAIDVRLSAGALLLADKLDRLDANRHRELLLTGTVSPDAFAIRVSGPVPVRGAGQPSTSNASEAHDEGDGSSVSVDFVNTSGSDAGGGSGKPCDGITAAAEGEVWGDGIADDDNSDVESLDEDDAIDEALAEAEVEAVDEEEAAAAEWLHSCAEC